MPGITLTWSFTPRTAATRLSSSASTGLLQQDGGQFECTGQCNMMACRIINYTCMGGCSEAYKRRCADVIHTDLVNEIPSINTSHHTPSHHITSHDTTSHHITHLARSPALAGATPRYSAASSSLSVTVCSCTILNPCDSSFSLCAETEWYGVSA